MLARILVERDAEPITDTMEWREILQNAQGVQLGEDWVERINASKVHSLRRVEIIRRCSRKISPAKLDQACEPILDALNSVGGRDHGWFFCARPEYMRPTLVQIPTGELPWLEIALYGEMEMSNAQG